MGRRDETKADTRARIARAARASFEARGFDQTTIRGVADAAGVGTGTVLLHFGSKVELLVGCWLEEIEAALEAQVATLPEGAVERRLAHLFRGFYAMYGARPELARVYVQQLIAVPADRAEPYDRVTASFVGRVVALLAEAPLVADLDLGVVAAAVFGLYVLDLADFLRRPRDPDAAAADLEARIGALLRPMRGDGSGAAAPRT